MTPHRPPAPTEHAGNWPTLRICPHCGGDLRERPPRGHCPQCTIDYDEHTWSAPCWTHIHAMRRPMWPIALPLIVAAVLAFTFPWLILLAILLAAIFIGRLMSFNPKRPPNAAIIAWPAGLSIRARRSRRMVTIPWDDCDEVIVRDVLDDDDTDVIPAIAWPIILVWDLLEPKPDVSEAREIAIKRRPSGDGPAFAEVVVVEDRPESLAQLIRDTIQVRAAAARSASLRGRAAGARG